MAKSLTVEVTPKLTVDRETADVCVRLVNWFLDEHEDMQLELLCDDHGARWAITSGPTEPSKDGCAKQERAKFRKLAGLEGE